MYIYIYIYIHIYALSKEFTRKAAARNIRLLLKTKSFSKMEKMLTHRWFKTKILYQLLTLKRIKCFSFKL